MRLQCDIVLTLCRVNLGKTVKNLQISRKA